MAPISCRSPGGVVTRTGGPGGKPARSKSSWSLARRKVEARCSSATPISPRCQASPTSRRTGRRRCSRTPSGPQNLSPRRKRASAPARSPGGGPEEAGPQVLGAHLLGQVAADGRFRRGPLLQPALDRLQGLHVFRAVEAVPSRGTPGLGEAVAALPLAEHLGGKAGHGFHLGDGVHPGGGHALRVGQCIGFVKLLYISGSVAGAKVPEAA